MDQSLLLVVAAGMFVMMFFSSRKRKRQAAEMADKVQPGAKVMLNSGIFATIISVDGDRALVESTPGTRLEVSKAAIVRFITEPVAAEAEVAEDAVVAAVTPVAKAPAKKAAAAKPAASAAAKPAAKTPAKKAPAAKPATKSVK